MTTVTEAAPAVGMPSGQGEEKWFAAAPDFAAEVAALRKRVEELEGKIAEMLSDKDDYWSLVKCSNCGVLLNCNGSQREHESVWKARAEQAERERDAADEEAQNARSVAQMAASDRDEAMDNFDNLSLELERLEKQLTADNAALRERLATVEAALLIADELSDDLEDVAQELANRTHGQPRYEPIIRAALQTVTRYNEARAALAATPAAGEVE